MQTFLSDLPAHGRTNAGQMIQAGHLIAVGDRQCAVIEWVATFRIGIGSALPAFDRET